MMEALRLPCLVKLISGKKVDKATDKYLKSLINIDKDIYLKPLIADPRKYV